MLTKELLRNEDALAPHVVATAVFQVDLSHVRLRVATKRVSTRRNVIRRTHSSTKYARTHAAPNPNQLSRFKRSGEFGLELNQWRQNTLETG